MFRITSQAHGGAVVLKLEGRFNAAAVGELDACWRAIVDAGDSVPISVDLSDACLVDAAAQEQVTRMYRAGVRLVTRGCLMRDQVREIVSSR